MANYQQPGRQERPNRPTGSNPPARRPAATSNRSTPPAGSRSAGSTPAARRTATPRPAASQQQRKQDQPSKPKMKNRWISAILMVIATLGLCVFLSVFILDSAQELFGLNQPDNPIEVVIPEGATNKQVIDILYDRKVITKTLTFMLYSSLKVDEGEFTPGTYNLNSNMGYDEIIMYIRYGLMEQTTVKITFIEGWTLRVIADKLEAEGVCDADEFIEYLETAELDYEFIDRLPEDDLRFHRLEGYIFPDTYEFWVGEKVSSVAKKFLDNFENRITEEMETQMLNLGLTLDEAITLASVIQKEAGNEEEMSNVSSVFHNRLDDSATYPQLQSDVTIFYVNDEIKPYVDITNQTMYDSYNTYVREGLPIGPICNPGIDAIKAALNPAETDNYFFVTDVNGKYYYSKTTAEHDENVRIAFAEKPIDGDSTGEVHGTGVTSE
ncbi:endolytic transglycosylase MltG [Ruminococcaceae bacterium OttesenSCG-928-L11]|nr:endolytic transglycosylase MltG [Ruminococcaceae bacterium OttesenSCG-928-L11]